MLLRNQSGSFAQTGLYVQASLYLLLMQQRYGQAIESGLLWYLGSLSPEQVRLVPAEIQTLIMHRNALAEHLRPGQALPVVIREDWSCSKCFQKAACALSHKVCGCLSCTYELHRHSVSCSCSSCCEFASTHLVVAAWHGTAQHSTAQHRTLRILSKTCAPWSATCVRRSLSHAQVHSAP